MFGELVVATVGCQESGVPLASSYTQHFRAHTSLATHSLSHPSRPGLLKEVLSLERR